MAVRTANFYATNMPNTPETHVDRAIRSYQDEIDDMDNHSVLMQVYIEDGPDYSEERPWKIEHSNRMMETARKELEKRLTKGGFFEWTN